MSRKPDALLSIHDVMPETRPAIERVVDRLLAVNALPCTLLVVPGRNWSERDLDWLRRLVAEGFILAGHGWRHDTKPRGLKHRVHSAVISRNVAEHLALDANEICEMLSRCHAWFLQHDLPAPRLYVPPAWAMGALRAQHFQSLPFALYESLGGVYEAATRRFTPLPLLGYEADTLLRWSVLSVNNRMNVSAARLTRRPLRIAVHPYDLGYRLGARLEADLAQLYAWIAYESLADSRQQAA